jgi:hypothetical protein
MTKHDPLIDPDTDGFPELVYVMHDALDDLLGNEFDPDKPALAVELADASWKQLRGERWLERVRTILRSHGVDASVPGGYRCQCGETVLRFEDHVASRIAR